MRAEYDKEERAVCIFRAWKRGRSSLFFGVAEDVLSDPVWEVMVLGILFGSRSRGPGSTLFIPPNGLCASPFFDRDDLDTSSASIMRVGFLRCFMAEAIRR